jgi:hypothetical protein
MNGTEFMDAKAELLGRLPKAFQHFAEWSAYESFAHLNYKQYIDALTKIVNELDKSIKDYDAYVMSHPPTRIVCKNELQIAKKAEIRTLKQVKRDFDLAPRIFRLKVETDLEELERSKT